ncbi:hypothetical protein [Microvirga rosea]|uniref:hypothetical protein n=1 Tax=Microvirga rosea TaxID=2715425 RepID=UPI001D0A39C6|nr:hypothetical protein [Microvirga rosea]MCB8823548.1 hypothetical protein [Microvirga rosea]
MAGGIADYLMEFHLEDASSKPAPNAPKPIVTRRDEEQDRTAELVRNAEARVRDEERAVADRALKAALETARSEADDMLKAARSKWVAEAAEKLSQDLSTGFADLFDVLGNKIAHVLVPFLSESLRVQAVSDFSDALSLLCKHEAVKITVSGPADLIEAVREKIGALEYNVEYVPGSGPDLKLTADDTVVEAQLSTWISRMADAVRSSQNA